MMTFAELRTANILRQKQWRRDGAPLPALYFSNALGGEAGEVCNVVKKLERERLGYPGSRATMEDLADELADVIIYADLLAETCGIDLGRAVSEKFNKTSDKLGFSVRLDPAPPNQDHERG
jgi:NTP pyrophosphatase (non-canonical NTP hydrolase)